MSSFFKRIATLKGEELQTLAVLCACTALLIGATVLISKDSISSSLASDRLLSDISTVPLVAATWLAQQQGYRAYSGTPMPESCYNDAISERYRNYGSLPHCNVNNPYSISPYTFWYGGAYQVGPLAVFSVHKEGVAAGQSAVGYGIGTVNYEYTFSRPTTAQLREVPSNRGEFYESLYCYYDDLRVYDWVCQNLYGENFPTLEAAAAADCGVLGLEYRASGSGGPGCYSAATLPPVWSSTSRTTGSPGTVETGGTVTLEWSCQPRQEQTWTYCHDYPGCWDTAERQYSINFLQGGSNYGGSVGSTNVTAPTTPGTYYYDFSCSGSAGTISASIPIIVTGPSVPPTEPTNLNYSCQNGGTVVDVSWTAPSGATSYDTWLNDPSNDGGPGCSGWYCPGSDDQALTTVVASPKTYYGITPGTAYTAWVRATNAQGSSPDTSVSFTCSGGPVPPTTPSIPTNLSIQCLSGTQAQFSWSASTGATSYGVYLDSSPPTIITALSTVFNVAEGSTHLPWVYASDGTNDSTPVTSGPFTCTTCTGANEHSDITGTCVCDTGYQRDLGGECVLVPTISNFRAVPERVRKGNTSTLQWDVDNPPATCTITNGLGGAETFFRTIGGAQLPTGSTATNPINQRTTFTLSCGTSPDAQATVTLIPEFEEF